MLTIETEARLKLILTLSQMFFRASSQSHILDSCFDWFTGLSVSFVIGWRVFFYFYDTRFFKVAITALFDRGSKMVFTTALALLYYAHLIIIFKCSKTTL